MEFISEYGLFLAKAVTLVAAILIVAGSLGAMAIRRSRDSDHELNITPLNKEYEQMENALTHAGMSPAAQKVLVKAEHKKEKKQAKIDKKTQKKKSGDDESTEQRKRLFVIDFDGDIRASDTDTMRNEISAILTNATEQDEVLVRLESGGGMVHSYGLAASQLQRIRDRGIPLTIAVDKIAASGGYMMACVANKIIAAPFSIIGSIGVLAQIPNVHRLLKDNKVDFEQLSAGEYKRTLTIFGENTDKDRAKMQQELEETHQHFKEFIHSQRPSLDVDRVATGEHWLGTRAIELGLVDKLQTSDDYLMAALDDRELLHLSYSHRRKLTEKIADMFTRLRGEREKSLSEIQRQLLM